MAHAKAVQAGSAKLAPVVVSNETEALDQAFNGVRKRPVLARNRNGKLIVCCKRTAVKRGWKLEGDLHDSTEAKKARVRAALRRIKVDISELNSLEEYLS